MNYVDESEIGNARNKVRKSLKPEVGKYILSYFSWKGSV